MKRFILTVIGGVLIYTCGYMHGEYGKTIWTIATEKLEEENRRIGK